MERKFIRVDRDLVGFKNNLLTGIRKIEKNKRWYWECLCDCGNTTTIREDFLLSGKTKSCGCFGSRNSVYKINQKPPGESTINSYFRSYEQAAKRRKFEFKITKEQFINLIFQNCYYCNSEPRINSHSKNDHGSIKTNGVDRIDNLIGYTLNNCITCCKECNFAKSTLTLDLFYKQIIKIYKYKELSKYE